MFIIKNKGFTLIEILIALFVFTILSLILAGGLRSVINTHAGTEKKAERLHDLQISLLMISRDLEQAVDRPVVNASGKEDAAFIGDKQHFTLTRIGAARTPNSSRTSYLQRVDISWNEDSLWRRTADAIDQTEKSKWLERRLLNEVQRVDFYYLDKDGKFHQGWPLENATDQALPRAVRVDLTLSKWGSISQLYVIPVQSKQDANSSPPRD